MAAAIPMVTYTYDADGRLSQTTNGNGTYTTYTYDDNGNVLDLINYAPGGTVNSSLPTPTIRSAWKPAKQRSMDNGTIPMTAHGQLTHAVFTPNSTDPDGSSAQN